MYFIEVHTAIGKSERSGFRRAFTRISDKEIKEKGQKLRKCI
ncbi:hypothetical protein NSP_33700 [Nodularia spumigena CCY9414]|jgi:hypothetical protein|nr:hypothetical protein NSP_33700 [Nodularia spumigena CCY9414]